LSSLDPKPINACLILKGSFAPHVGHSDRLDPLPKADIADAGSKDIGDSSELPK